MYVQLEDVDEEVRFKVDRSRCCRGEPTAIYLILSSTIPSCAEVSCQSMSVKLSRVESKSSRKSFSTQPQLALTDTTLLHFVPLSIENRFKEVNGTCTMYPVATSQSMGIPSSIAFFRAFHTCLLRSFSSLFFLT